MDKIKGAISSFKNRESSHVAGGGSQHVKLNNFQTHHALAHGFIGLWVFIVWCLTIVVFRGDGGVDSRTVYMFVVVSAYYREAQCSC